MSNYDIIIIGAGPAGSMAAITAAKKGLSVALIDRRNRIGYPKQCAEGINKNIFSLVGLKKQDEWISNKIDSLIGGTPGKGKLYLKAKRSEGYILERKVFDPALSEIAESCGANLITGTEVLSINKERVKLKNKTLNTKAIIAANGPSGSVARMIGAEVVKNGIGLQYEIKAKSEFPHSLQAYFGLNVINPGWAWIFPKADTLNVGIGSFKMMNLKSHLDKFVKNVGVKGKIVETNGGLIPLHGPIKEIVHKNVLFIGDAAGHTNPVSGGGIPAAMYDGKLASEILAEELLEKKPNFKRYEQEWEKSIFGSSMKKSLKVQKLYLDSLNKGYFDKFFGNFEFEEVTKRSDLLRILKKAPNLKILTRFAHMGKLFAKPYEYAW